MTVQETQDRWAKWLLETRFSGDRERQKAFEKYVFRVRDRVLTNAKVDEGDVLLDVGAGDGLIAFGALPIVVDQGQDFPITGHDHLGNAEARRLTQRVHKVQLAPRLLGAAIARPVQAQSVSLSSR